MRATGLILMLLAVALPASASAQQPKKVITHETLWMMKRVGDPVASPDGKWVVYSLTEPNYDPEKAVSDLWLVPAEGSAPPRRITSSKSAESDPVWSPDSRSLAFSAKREGDEVAQIYVLPMGGGEARRVTASPAAAVRPQWRPDGQALLYESAIYPGTTDLATNRAAQEEVKRRKYSVRVYESSPIRYWDIWLDERRSSLWVQPLAEGAEARDVLAGSALAREAGFAAARQGENSFSLMPVWTPDGREIVFTATTEANQQARAPVAYRLYRISATGGEPVPVTGAAGNYSQMSFSPDGRTLAFLFSPEDQEVYNLPRLHRLAWPAGGEAVPVAASFDREPARYAFTPDSRTIYMSVPEGAKQNIYRVPAAGGRPELAIQPERGGYQRLSIPAKAARPILIASYGSSVEPTEIVRLEPGRRGHVPLTAVNSAEAATIDWAPPRHFTFQSKGGKTIHNLLVLPPAFDPTRKYPLVTVIHGGPATSNADQISLRWNYHLLAAPGYVLLLTDYTGSTGYGERFAQSIKGDPLRLPGEEIEQAVDEALRRYPFIDGDRMCASGASYGGHLTYWLQATSTRYKCLISHAGLVDLATQWGESDVNYSRELMNGGPPWAGNPVWREQSAISYGAQWKTPMLLSIGERDYRVPLGNTLQGWTVLQRMNVPSRLLVWPEAGHWILRPEDSRQFYKEVHAWLARWLKDAPVPGPAPVAASD